MPEAIEALCPACDSKFLVLAKHEGKRVKCPKCGNIQLLQRQPAAAIDSAPAVAISPRISSSDRRKRKKRPSTGARLFRQCVLFVFSLAPAAGFAYYIDLPRLLQERLSPTRRPVGQQVVVESPTPSRANPAPRFVPQPQQRSNNAPVRQALARKPLAHSPPVVHQVEAVRDSDLIVPKGFRLANPKDPFVVKAKIELDRRRYRVRFRELGIPPDASVRLDDLIDCNVTSYFEPRTGRFDEDGEVKVVFGTTPTTMITVSIEQVGGANSKEPCLTIEPGVVTFKNHEVPLTMHALSGQERIIRRMAKRGGYSKANKETILAMLNGMKAHADNLERQVQLKLAVTPRVKQN